MLCPAAWSSNQPCLAPGVVKKRCGVCVHPSPIFPKYPGSTPPPSKGSAFLFSAVLWGKHSSGRDRESTAPKSGRGAGREQQEDELGVRVR